MRKIFAVSLVFLSSGCAVPDVVDIGYHGSDEGYVAALQAADAWNQSCGRDLVNVHRGDGEVQTYERSGYTNGAAGETEIDRPFMNMIGPKYPSTIWHTSGWEALPALTHEFGHALGLEHTHRGIMQPGNELPSLAALLDPTTRHTTLLPGLILPEDCALVR
jgi:hypothetical protein